MRQNFSLMSNRLDDFHFVLFLSLSFFVFLLPHTRLLHLCYCGRRSFFEFPHIRVEEKKKQEKKEKCMPIDSSSQLKRSTRCSYEKRTLAKKGLRARVSSSAQLIEVHLCARPAARRSESAVWDDGSYGGVRGVHFRPFPSGTRVDEPRTA